jgi:hypothetical protein
VQCSPGGLAVKSLFISVDGISRLCAAATLARRPGASRQTGGLPAQHVDLVAGLPLGASLLVRGFRMAPLEDEAKAGDLNLKSTGLTHNFPVVLAV